MTDVKSALDVARRYGAALEEDLPWKGALYPGGIDHFYPSAAHRGSRTTTGSIRRMTPGDWFAALAPLDRPAGTGADRGRRRPRVRGRRAAAGLLRLRVGLVQPRRGARRLRAERLPRALQLGRGLGRGGYAAATEDYLARANVETYGVVV